MTVRKICANEVTSVVASLTETVTCSSPAFTPVAPGDAANVALYNVAVNLDTVPPTLSFSFDAQLQYQFLNSGATFVDFCLIHGRSGSLDLPTNLTTCYGDSVPPAVVEYSAAFKPGSIATTPNSVSGGITVSFTVSDLCAPTIICVEDTVCP